MQAQIAPFGIVTAVRHAISTKGVTCTLCEVQLVILRVAASVRGREVMCLFKLKLFEHINVVCACTTLFS